MAMTDNEDFDYGDDPDDDEQETTQSDNERVTTISSKDLKQLRKKANSADAGDAARRELAMLKAGIDTESKTGKLFLDSYRGDLSGDAIKEAGDGIPGLFKASDTLSDQTQTSGEDGGEGEANQLQPGEDQSTKERGALQTDSVPDDGKGRNVREDALTKAREANKRGATEEEALGSFVGDLAGAYGTGDKSVVAKANEG